MTYSKARFKADLHEFLVFGLKQARACVFVGSFFAVLISTELHTFIRISPLRHLVFSGYCHPGCFGVNEARNQRRSEGHHALSYHWFLFGAL